MPIRKLVLVTAVLFGATGIPAIAQPFQILVRFTSTSAFVLEKGGGVLPAGNYVLFQLYRNDRQLFALYRDHMAHSPVALLRTTRIHYFAMPGEAKVLINTDESSPQSYPVLRGWYVHGDDGFEVTKVNLKRRALQALQNLTSQSTH